MKKVFRIFLLFLTVFVMTGCNKEVSSKNVFNVAYKEVNTSEDVIYNLNEAIHDVNGVNFEAVLTIKDQEYVLAGEAIFKDTIEKSTIHVNYKDNNLYLKNGKVYISYYYNNTNVIIKDSLDNFIEEAIGSLENKGVKCNKEKIYDFIKNKTIADINFNSLTKYLIMNENQSSFNYKKYSVILNENFLPSEFVYENSKFKADVNFNYDEVSIKMPVGYNILTINIADIKELLKVNYISDLIK